MLWFMGSQRVRHDWPTELNKPGTLLCALRHKEQNRQNSLLSWSWYSSLSWHDIERIQWDNAYKILSIVLDRGGSDGKESAYNEGFNPWVGNILWIKEWKPTPVFLPGEFHGQRSLEGYNTWGHKELDTTEWLTHTCAWHIISAQPVSTFVDAIIASHS